MLLALRHPTAVDRVRLDPDRARVVASLGPRTTSDMGGVNDKVEHIVGYLVLALWFAGISSEAALSDDRGVACSAWAS